ncbi:hypothetical protein Hanom_Chr01g00055651 [Helianthus anomalus]
MRLFLLFGASDLNFSKTALKEVKKMPLKRVDATVSTFNAVFEKFKSEAPNNKNNLILFLADNEPSTNRSWCPGNTISLLITDFNFQL